MCVCACEEPRGRVGGAKQTVGRARERQGERDSLEKSRHFLKLNVLRCGINLGGPAGEETLPPCSSCCVYRRQEQQTQPISGHSLSLTPITFVSVYRRTLAGVECVYVIRLLCGSSRNSSASLLQRLLLRLLLCGPKNCRGGVCVPLLLCASPAEAT